MLMWHTEKVVVSICVEGYNFLSSGSCTCIFGAPEIA